MDTFLLSDPAPDDPAPDRPRRPSPPQVLGTAPPRVANFRLAAEVAWRYLRGRKSRLLGGTGRVALVATALGVTAMVVAMALMTGYRGDLVNKLVGGSAAVLAYPLDLDAVGADDDREAAIAALPGVTRVALVAYAQGALSSATHPDGVEITVRALERPDAPPFPVDRFISPDLELGTAAAPAAVLGEELARRLGVGPGDAVRLTVLALRHSRPRFAYRTLRVAATFRTGFAEFDASWIGLPLAALDAMVGGSAPGRVYEISIAELDRAGQVATAVETALGSGWLVTDWQQLNRELFTALRLQQWVLFLTLGLIVLVSTFNVASTLVVLVRERMRDIGVLVAVGLPAGALRAVFLLYGLALGAAGTAIGLVLGGGAAYLLGHYELIRFDAEVAAIYFLAAVPFRVELADLAAVAGFSLGVTLLACWLPSRRALRVEPSAALRYE